MTKPIYRSIVSTLFFALSLSCFSRPACAKDEPGAREVLAPVPVPAEPARGRVSIQTGTASYYGGSFIGRKTASGERYRVGDRTAAHRTLPFGTYVRVINLSNGRSAIVRINNRGPYTRHRLIDLSMQAAADLAMLKAGTARVRLEVLSREAATTELSAAKGVL